MTLLNYDINDLISIETNTEKSDGYSFIKVNGKPSNTLENLSRINFFVGANNSGKSRFIRSIFKKKTEVIISLKKTQKTFSDLIVLYKKEISSFIEKECSSIKYDFSVFLDKKYDASLKRNENLVSLPEQFKENIEKYFNRKDNLAVLFNKASIMDKDRRDNFLIPKIIEINNKYLDLLDDYNPYEINYVYIPVLRGLRKLSQEKCFYNRTIKDYFSENEKDLIAGGKNKEIFTGLSMYEDVKTLLLSKQEERNKIRDFEDFLSENFFENNPISLVPHIESDVLFIKIGDDNELPIYEVGDGIQQLIILTYPLFKNIGKNMFIFMEEPELFLHPGLQRRFIEILRSEKFDTFKFFIATHSNNFLDISLENESKEISIYTFEKIEKDKTFIVKNVASGENNILKLLGANNTSMFMSNCSVWVEGVTDRIYLRSYIKAYENHLKKNKELKHSFKEGIHYSFFEYAGSNLSHYIFEEPDKFKNEIVAPYLSNRIFLLADQDEGKEEKHKKLEKISNDNAKFTYKMLPVREIENMISEDLLKTILGLLPNSWVRI